METKYNLLTRLLKNIKNVVNPDGSIAGSGGGGVPVAHIVTEETVAVSGTLPDVAGYQWIPRQSDPSGEVTSGPFIQIDLDNASDFINPEVFIKPMTCTSWRQVNAVNVIEGRGYVKINVGEFGMDGQYPSEDYFNGALIKVVSEISTRLDKTYKELVDSGFFVVRAVGMDDLYPNRVSLLIPGGFINGDPECSIGLLDLMERNPVVFVASTENDYPVLLDIGGNQGPIS